MYTGNYVDFFRFADKYEDVFCEDNHYLYACAEPYDWGHFVTVCEYHKLDDNKWIRFEYGPADMEYLLSLTPAPIATAKNIINLHTAETWPELCTDEEEYMHE